MIFVREHIDANPLNILCMSQVSPVFHTVETVKLAIKLN